MKKRMFFTILGLTLVFGGVFGFNWYVSQQIDQAMSNQPPPTETVSATAAEETVWQPTLSAVGSLRAVQGIDLTAEINGRVTEVAVEDGAAVEQGQVIVRLDAAELQAELRGAQAEAQLAQLEIDRQRRLREQNAASQSAVDRAQSQLEQARARVAGIQARLDKKTITAPFSGRLGILQVDSGQYIDTGRMIATLQTLEPIDVDFALPQSQLPRVRAGQELTARVDAFGERSFEGQVTAISPQVDVSTRNADIRGRLANEERLLQPGMFVDVAVQLPQTDNVVTLPRTAITYNPYGDSVFVVREGQPEGDDDAPVLTVERVFVQTGENRGGEVQILDGISVGQRVVTSGQLKLRNGTRVRIDNSVAPSSDPSPELGNS
ncbi:MAG: efflux RND transporter periplasmic adaptor subunit [Halofilum sp. (in: g-proteobacteria)]